MNYQYLAGLLDGEGYFGLIPKKDREPYKYFSPVIKVSSTNERIIDLLKESFGGYKERRVFKSHPNSKLAYTWVAKDRKTIWRILRNIRPWLIVKEEVAELIYSFIIHGRFGKRNLSPEIIQWRNELYKKVRLLNRRGLPPAETERVNS